MHHHTLVFGLLLPSISFAQDVVYVTNLDDAGPGSFRDAIATAFDYDTVRIQITGTVSLTTGQITYDKTLVIEGPGMDQFIISGNDLVVPLMITGGSTYMSGLTIRDGFEPTGVPGLGGGMSFTGDTLNMRDVRITECNMTGTGGGPREGGGLRAVGAQVRIHDCAFTGNNILPGQDDIGSAWGGGVYISCDDILVRSSTITGNIARGGQFQFLGSSAGGGLYILGSGRIENCTIEDNIARTHTYVGGGADGYAQGGGLFVEYGGTVTVSGGSISGNSTDVIADGDAHQYGAGIYGRGVVLTVENCTLNNNTMPADQPAFIPCEGGAVYLANGRLTMHDCTLDGNAASSGSGIFCDETGGSFEQHKIRLQRVRVLNGSGYPQTAAVTVLFADSTSLIDVEVSDNDHCGLFARGCATLHLDRCLFEGNAFGGVMLLEQGEDNHIVNTTFTGNVAGEGAGLHASDTPAIYLNNCTFVDDTLDGSVKLPEGREIYLSISAVHMRNTIMSSTGFQAVDVFGGPFASGYSLGGNIARDSSASGFLTEPTDLNNADPELGSFDDHGGFSHTWSLAENSTSIDRGGPDTLTVDQRGFLRDGSADAGAFEYGGLDPQIFLEGTSDDALVCLGAPLMVSVQATSMATISYQWQLDGIDIPGATSSDYSTSAAFTDAGAYTCVLATAGDALVAGPILITVESCMGIVHGSVQPVRVWPVPTRDVLWLDLPSDDAISVTIRDASGRLMHQQRISASGPQAIDVSAWPAGTYAIELLDGEQKAVVRFVKE